MDLFIHVFIRMMEEKKHSIDEEWLAVISRAKGTLPDSKRSTPALIVLNHLVQFWLRNIYKVCQLCKFLDIWFIYVQCC